MPTEDKLTFIEDRVILIISTLGLLLVTAAVFWVVRQSPDWGAINRVEGEEEGAEGLLQGRTRVVAGGREALKAARKQAKKRAKAEFRESSVGQKRRNRVQQHEVREMNTLAYLGVQMIHILYRGNATTEFEKIFVCISQVCIYQVTAVQQYQGCAHDIVRVTLDFS